MEIKGTSDIKFFDYGKSFVLTENHPQNTPRFIIEAKCTMNGDDYYLCAPCKGEHTYAKTDLFEKQAFEFTPIIGNKEVLVFRRFGFFNHQELNEYKKVYDSKDLWGDKVILEKTIKAKELLDTGEKIVSAVKSGHPIMSRLVFKGIIIDFPIKTINVHKNKWQVDTGPILLPNIQEFSPYKIFLFDLAYVAFNSFKFVEFLGRDLFKLTNDYWIAHYCKSKILKKPEIYLYSL